MTDAIGDLVQNGRQVLLPSISQFAEDMWLFDNFGQGRCASLQSDIEKPVLDLLGVVADDYVEISVLAGGSEASLQTLTYH